MFRESMSAMRPARRRRCLRLPAKNQTCVKQVKTDNTSIPLATRKTAKSKCNARHINNEKSSALSHLANAKHKIAKINHYLGSMFDLKEGVVGDKRLAEVAPALCHQSLEGALSGLSRAEVWPVTSHQFHSHLLLVHV